MSSMSNKLKPCKCGSTGMVVSNVYYDGYYCCAIGCRNPDCKGSVIVRYSMFERIAYSKAESAWNRRNENG